LLSYLKEVYKSTAYSILLSTTSSTTPSTSAKMINAPPQNQLPIINAPPAIKRRPLLTKLTFI
jgi:hypothetical protein